MAADGTVTIQIKTDGKDAERSVKGLRGLLEGLGGHVQKTTSRVGDMVKALGLVKIAEAGFNLLKNSMDGAVKRLDVLRSADKVFANMGFSADETKTMMDNLNASIKGLPTPLDQAVSGVQLIASATGDLAGSEKIYSAMNNAILGFGGDTEMVNNAVLQLSQSLADGKIDGQTWNSMLNSQMGPTLRAIADMMGITMGELKSGLSDGSIAVDDFIDTLVTLNEEGGGGLESLQQIAQDATGGIQTSIANMRTAVSRGLANMIDAIDEALVAANFPSIGEMISNVGSVIEQGITKASEVVGPLILLLGELFDKVRNSTAFQSFKDVVSTAFDTASQAVSDFAQSETWQTIKDAVKDIAQAILDIDFGEVISQVGEFLDKWSPLIIGVVAGIAAFKAITAVMAIVTGVISAVSAVGGILAVVMGALASPVLIVAAVIGALVAIGVLLYKNWDTIKEKASELGIDLETTWESIKEVATTIWEGIKEVFFTVVDAVVEFVMDIFGGLVEWWNENNELIRETVTVIWNYIKEEIENVLAIIVPAIMLAWEVIKGVTEVAWEIIKGIIEFVWDRIKTIVEVAIELVKGIITTVMKIITGDWEGAWETIKSTLENIWKIIKGHIERTIENIKNTISNVLDIIKEKWDTIWGAIKDFVSGIWDEMKTKISETWNSIKTNITDSINSVKTTISDKLNEIKNKFTEIWDSIVTSVKTKFTEVENNVTTGMNDAYNAVTAKLSDFKDAGKKIITNIADGIKSKVNAIKDGVSSALEKARNLLPFSPPKDKSSPLADIHKNGIMEQVAKGVYDEGDLVDKALKKTLKMPDVNRFIPQFGTANGVGMTTNHSQTSMIDNRNFTFNANANGTESNDREFYERLFREFKWYIQQEGGAFN